ncbi:MAG: hypothetical protein ACK5EN_07935 [Planctomyces sp.]
MPVHDPGYRTWQGPTAPLATRWMVIAEVGIRRAWLSSWLRRMMFFAWLPACVMGFMVFLYEQTSANDPNAGRTMLGLSRMLIDPGSAASSSFADVQTAIERRDQSPESERHLFWSALLTTLFRRSQPFILIPMLGIIVPPLISQDFRSRAFLLYFSRPITRLHYILGKAACVMFFLASVTLAPAVLLFSAAVLLSPSLTVLASTWDLSLRILAASLAIMIPCTCLSLMLSSLASESRYASFAWFAIWIFGELAWLAASRSAAVGSNVVISCLSLFRVFSDVTAWILDPRLVLEDIQTRLVVLAAISAVSLAVLFRRVSAPMQI